MAIRATSYPTDWLSDRLAIRPIGSIGSDRLLSDWLAIRPNGYLIDCLTDQLASYYPTDFTSYSYPILRPTGYVTTAAAAARFINSARLSGM